ncbi:hypothetical protein QUB80_02730 [Chlorogloeopsis sp. ULAP01]|uniref:hypothetical protein n=1 Tax=Chlorogloeopsis sp. ULAP01 TaxID=3056483 RepID=UPI0025AABEAB|nr:hypothetical protein [Chlorogloeopsis sp. ULAP01]MDM9379617.1 hypothetical protein [Chlorogloeopsis sp. ULAP01]
MYKLNGTQDYWNQIQKYFKIKQAKEHYIKRLAWFLIFGLAVYSIYLLHTRAEAVSLDKAFLALGVIWLGFLPTIQFLLDRNRPPMPFFPLLGIFYATSFGLPIFAAKEEFSSLASVSNEALILTFIGLAGMNIAFFASKSTLLKKVLPFRLTQKYPINRLLIAIWILLLSNTVIRYAFPDAPSVSMFTSKSLYIAYGMFYILWNRRKLPKIQTWLLVLIFIPLEIVPRLASGLLAEFMLLCLFMFHMVWYERKKIPIVLIAILIVLYLAFNPVKSDYRSLTWGDNRPQGQLNLIERLELFINLAVEYHQQYTFNDSPVQSAPKISATDKVIERSAQIVLLSDVMESSPEIVPYWNGETYFPLLTSYIPRAVWPEKPVLNTGNEFGRRYKIIDVNDFVTSVNLPMLVEMYVNFGSWGVIIGMPLLGFLLALIDQKLNHPAMNELEFVIGASTIFQLSYQESSASLLLGNVIPFVVANYIFFKLILGRQRFESIRK